MLFSVLSPAAQPPSPSQTLEYLTLEKVTTLQGLPLGGL
jgi:hypothetical protein